MIDYACTYLAYFVVFILNGQEDRLEARSDMKVDMY
jgi:hypothetical protein